MQSLPAGGSSGLRGGSVIHLAARRNIRYYLLSERRADRTTYSLLHEVAELPLIFDLDQLLAAIGRVGDVQLHLGDGCWRSTLVTGVRRKSSRDRELPE